MKKYIGLLLCILLVGCSQEVATKEVEDNVQSEVEDTSEVETTDETTQDNENEDNVSEQVEEQPSSEQTKEVTRDGNQSLTPEVFQQQFNELSSEFIGEDTYVINDIPVEDGEENDSFQINFNENIFLVGIVDDNNEVSSAMVSMVEDGSVETSPYNIGMVKSMIRIFSPTLTEDEMYTVMEDLYFLTGYSELMDQIGTTWETDVEGVHYSINYSMTDEGYVLCILNVDKLTY